VTDAARCGCLATVTLEMVSKFGQLTDAGTELAATIAYPAEPKPVSVLGGGRSSCSVFGNVPRFLWSHRLQTPKWPDLRPRKAKNNVQRLKRCRKKDPVEKSNLRRITRKKSRAEAM
jgi:hypothetical protein